MRSDAIGMFWQDVPKVKKVKEKRVPPERTWELPDHLPYFDEAIKFPVTMYGDNDLYKESRNLEGKELFVFDIESYPNYFCIGFRGTRTKKVVLVEIVGADAEITLEDKAKVEWMIANFTLISFNGRNYDIPLMTLYLNGINVHGLKKATNLIIDGDPETGQWMRPYQVLRKFKTKTLKEIDHIDIIEVAPLSASLKIYSARLHCDRAQDLPYPPNRELTPDQIKVTRWYCINDLSNTELLYLNLLKQIELRKQIGVRYGVDLRSKSDAQIAEELIAKEIQTATGTYPRRLDDEQVNSYIGQAYKYPAPPFLKFSTNDLKWVLDTVISTYFVVSPSGRIKMPKELAKMKIPIGQAKYTMGIGGLHSNESSVHYVADADNEIIDRDVTSYYPRIILNLGLYPQHLGPMFLKVYNSIVERRLEAKAAGDKLTADSLKITVNGSFGKTANKHSLFYEPMMTIITTITGQLSLLMLIERLHLNGFTVVSANTDGIVTLVPKVNKTLFNIIIKKWEDDTRFNTEETQYKALYSRDVNNYIAQYVDSDSKPLDKRVKLKGTFGYAGLSKTPQNEICNEAVIRYLLDKTPIDLTVRSCSDLTKFITVRKVNGGAVKDGAYLGSTVRWYYKEGELGEIVYAKTGNKVPKSDGAHPIPDMPSGFPDDLDFNWYIDEVKSILTDLGIEDYKNEIS